MEVDHVTERTIRECGAEYRDIVLGCPVVDTALVVDLVAEPRDDATRCPSKCLAVIFGWRGVLLAAHRIENRHHPIFKLAIVVVWDEQVADPVQTLLAQRRAVQVESAQIRRPEALDKVFLDAARSCDDRRDVLVLDKEVDHLAES